MTTKDHCEQSTDASKAEGDKVVDLPLAQPEVSSDEVENLRAELAEVRGSHLRALADLENYRKRVEDEKERGQLLAAKQVVERMLPILDDFDAAIADFEKEVETPKEQNHLTGLNQIRQKMFTDLGLEPIKAWGAAFDPNLHLAIEFEDGEGAQVVKKVHQRGYLLGEMVLRPAVVSVGCEKEGVTSGGDDES